MTLMERWVSLLIEPTSVAQARKKRRRYEKLKKFGERQISKAIKEVKDETDGRKR